jgi:hypothetical protein
MEARFMIQKFALVRITAAPLLVLWLCLSISLAAIGVESAIQPPDANTVLESKLQERFKRDPHEHLSVTEFKELFGELIKQTGQPLHVAYEHYEKLGEAAKNAQPWWRDFKPNLGWITSAMLALLILFRDFLFKRIETAFQTLWDMGYRRLARLRLFRRWALRRYRKSIVANHRLLKIPFRPDRPLEMEKVFVRLKLEGSEASGLIDAEQAVGKARVCLVLGPAGSGKSMLMRKLCLTLAGSSAGTPRQPVPVLVELSRVSEAEGGIRERLIASFAQNDFPNAEKFIDAGLEKGFLLLLLDGLDEVSSEKKEGGLSARDRVVQQIEDMASKHRACRFLITCRNAVYHGELDECADQRLSIVEFTDEQIHLFLNAWVPEMPADKSVEQLLRNLRERPRIMALARNPLLLTIIAFLYTDTEFILPHSRAEFYEKAVDALLDHWKRERNRFKRAHKALVLQHLALWNQDNAPSDSPDRRTMDLGLLIAEIKTVLHTLNWPETDAQGMLDEITERSGLLVSLDGGQRYQFTHLTLQEFMAAKKLEMDMEGLLSRLEQAPDDWRETVKLWCGLPHDSTHLIKRLRILDPVLALECLSDTEQLDDTVQKSILDEFKPRLAEGSYQGENIIRSFALVAADPRPRGEGIFEYLKGVLSSPTSTETMFAAACRALSLTNLPQAAECLAHVATKHALARPYLAHMGDIAVPALGVLGANAVPTRYFYDGIEVPAHENFDACENFEMEWVAAVLYDIGSPLAAQQLVKFLHLPLTRVANDSAWALGALVKHPDIEASLSKFPSSPLFTGASQYSWVWEPFGGVGTTVTMIMARVAAMIRQDEYPTFHTRYHLDSRLVISFILAEENLPFISDTDERKRVNKAFAEHLETLEFCSTVEERDQMKDTWVRNTMSEKWWTIHSPIFSGASLDVKWELLALASMEKPGKQIKRVYSIAEWQNLNRPSDYHYATSWQAKILGCVACLFLCVIAAGLWGNPISWISIFTVFIVGIAAVLTLLSVFGVGVNNFWIFLRYMSLFGVSWMALILPCVAMPFAISARGPSTEMTPWAYAVAWGIGCAIPPAAGIIWYGWRWSRNFSGMWQTLGIMSLWGGASCILHAWSIEVHSSSLFLGAVNSGWRAGLIPAAVFTFSICQEEMNDKKSLIGSAVLAIAVGAISSLLFCLLCALPALPSFFFVVEMERVTGGDNLMPVIALICTIVGITAASTNYQHNLSSNKLRAALEKMDFLTKCQWFNHTKSLRQKLTGK